MKVVVEYSDKKCIENMEDEDLSRLFHEIDNISKTFDSRYFFYRIKYKDIEYDDYTITFEVDYRRTFKTCISIFFYSPKNIDFESVWERDRRKNMELLKEFLENLVSELKDNVVMGV